MNRTEETCRRRSPGKDAPSLNLLFVSTTYVNQRGPGREIQHVSANNPRCGQCLSAAFRPLFVRFLLLAECLTRTLGISPLRTTP